MKEKEAIALHDAVFNSKWDAIGFKSSDWNIYRFDCGLNLSSECFTLLETTCKISGDLGIYITDIEIVPPHQNMIFTGLSINEIMAANGTLLGHVWTHIFGISASWGLICTQNDESYFGCAR